MNRTSLTLLRPMIIVFIMLNAFFLAGKTWLTENRIDPAVMIAGNLVLFVVSLITFFITYRSFQSKNPNSFVRAMYGGFIFKFFAVALTAFIYIIITRKNVNKPALFICMGLYIVYTVFEVGSLLKVLKQKKNG